MSYIISAISWREIDSSHRLMATIVIALGVLNFFFGEIIPEADGLGWDGVIFAKLVRSLDLMVYEGQLSSYYAQRLLPAASVRGLLLLAGASFSNINIIRGFECYNLVLLVGALWVWKRIANNFSISLGGRWFGFCGLFLNYMASKQCFYYPVLTDTTALFISLLVLLYYVEKRPLALLAATLVGSFCWQIASISGSVLLIFLSSNLPTEVVTPAAPAYSINSANFSRFIKLGWILLLMLSILGVIGLAFIDRGYYVARLATGLPSLVGVTVALAMLAGSVLFFQTLVATLRTTSLVLVILAIAALLIPLGIVRVISNPSIPNASSFIVVLRQILFPPSGKFLLPLVSLVTYWGPVVLLLLLNWKPFCREARKLGFGFMAVVGLNLLLGLSTEPRYVTYGWPFFVLGVVLAMESTYRRKIFKYTFAILTIFYAQFWIKLNLAPWQGERGEYISEFPKQMYFMHLGYWMNWWSYTFQFSAMALSTAWLRWSTLPPVKDLNNIS